MVSSLIFKNQDKEVADGTTGASIAIVLAV